MTPEQATEYLNGKYRSYDERAVRYRLSALAMMIMGFDENDSIIDFGGGDAELEKCLREEFGWRGLYTNIDYATGNEIEKVIGDLPAYWTHDFATGLEVVEHFEPNWAYHFATRLPRFARKGAVITTPNPDVQNIFDMDDTHRTRIFDRTLTGYGYTVEHHMLYDGYYSGGRVDGLVAYQAGQA